MNSNAMDAQARAERLVRPKPRGQVRKSGLVMAEKRKLEFDSLSGVSEVESADIHSVIASVSPMKKGKRASYS